MVKEETRSVYVERYVTEVILGLGVPAHLRGYHFIREGVLLSLEDPEVVTSVTKLLYPEIAKRYHTSSQKVERSIRNAIEVSWERGDAPHMEQLFGYGPSSGRHRPTNSEFLAGIVDKVLLDQKAGAIPADTGANSQPTSRRSLDVAS